MPSQLAAGVMTWAHTRLQVGPAGAVGNDGFGPLRRAQLGGCGHHRRVGAQGLVRPGGGQEVGLEQKGFSGPGVALYAAQPLDEKGQLLRRLGVILAGNDGYSVVHKGLPFHMIAYSIPSAGGKCNRKPPKIACGRVTRITLNLSKIRRTTLLFILS